MLDWIQTWPEWLQWTWGLYITCHDLIQWGVLVLLGYTEWGRRRYKKQLHELIEHIHEELHQHIEEDSKLHKDLGQQGISKGT